MKELIIKALQTKYPGVDAKIIDRMATKLAKTVTKEEDVQTAVDGVTFQQVLESYGDYRATEATQTAIGNYEKKHNLKDGKPVQAEPEPGKGDEERKAGSTGSGGGNEEKPTEEVPAYIKALMDRFDALEQRQKKQDEEKQHASRKAKLSGILKDAPEAVRKMYEDNFGNMKFDDDAKFDEWLTASKTTVDGIVNDMKQKGAIVTPPMAGGPKNKPEGEVNPILKAQMDAAKTNPIQGQQGSAVILGMPAKP